MPKLTTMAVWLGLGEIKKKGEISFLVSVPRLDKGK